MVPRAGAFGSKRARSDDTKRESKGDIRRADQRYRARQPCQLVDLAPAGGSLDGLG